jgi:DNA phosphorothioation-associated putative methyltransferase
MSSPIGKRVADELYVHVSAISECLDPIALSFSQAAQQTLPIGHNANVVKVNVRIKKFSWLEYEDFDNAPFPRLLSSWIFDMENGIKTSFRNYRSSLNPPILHRKELLVSEDYPGRGLWIELTNVAEDIGLFDNPSTIGFELNWLKVIEAKGYKLVGKTFLPIGNNVSSSLDISTASAKGNIQRHLTALSRTSISAPVQLLLRNGLLRPGCSFFDYGCGKGNDISSLLESGFNAAGWDPHYAKDHPTADADVVNLGFVINVIEDPAERVDAVHNAFRLTRGVLAVGVMLTPTDLKGLPYQDGVLTSRNTFQKYYSQAEIKSYLEDVLQREVFMAGPGVAFIFADEIWQQRFESARYRSGGIAKRFLGVVQSRSLRVRAPRPERRLRTSLSERQFSDHRVLLDRIWSAALDLGRFPDPDEIEFISEVEAAFKTLSRALRLITVFYDLGLLAQARAARIDDITVYIATQLFQKRTKYRSLDPRLQRDIKTFFGDYNCAQSTGFKLLLDCAKSEQLSTACVSAATDGLGWHEEGHSLQLHISLVERLPAILRVYVACGLLLWDSLSEVQVVKIHIISGKLTLLTFDDFDTSPIPLLRKRIKVNIRRLDYSIFEYGSADFPKPILYFKSRYLHEEHPGYADQLEFDEQLRQTGCFDDDGYGPTEDMFRRALEAKRLSVNGMHLERSSIVPDIDEKCGRHLTYRSFIECGETQSRLGIANLPTNVHTYNALYNLATNIIDPIIDYFGGIRLTYGLCTLELGRKISSRVSHGLDQHAACETKRNGRWVCERLGAACDFLVEDENMLEVAQWIAESLPFDRLYFYGESKPLHISFGPENSRTLVHMVTNASGFRMPRPLKFGRPPT